MISAYRGEDGIIEYIFGAGLAGAIVRMHLGLAATAVGFGVGTLFLNFKVENPNASP